MIKRLAFHTLAMLAAVVGALLALNAISRLAADVYKDGAAVFSEAKRNWIRSGKLGPVKDAQTVLFFGDSSIMAGINPDCFDRANAGRTHSYNLALPGLPIGPAFFELRDYLQHYPAPDCIVMPINIYYRNNYAMFSYYASQGVDNLSEMVSYLIHLTNKDVALNWLLPVRLFKYHIPVYVYNHFNHRDREAYRIQVNQVIRQTIKKYRGYYFIQELALAPEQMQRAISLLHSRQSEAAVVFDPFTDPYVKLFFDLTASRHIPVMLIQPALRSHFVQQYGSIPEQLSAILERYANVRIAAAGWKLKFYADENFSDLFHLSRSGAEKFSQDVAAEYRDAMR